MPGGSTSENWKVRTWNLGQILEIQLWMVGLNLVSDTVDGYFHSLIFLIANCSNKSSILMLNLVQSMHTTSLSDTSFPTALGSKLQLQLIYNHDRDCFPGFACQHLKLLCCSIEICRLPFHPQITMGSLLPIIDLVMMDNNGPIMTLIKGNNCPL